MYLLGYSIDNLSLMALTISVGFVVDDAIVMIENIVRYIEEGDRPFEAALKGAGQIGFTIISITFSLIAVFIPLLFMGGIVGRLFREFAVTVTVAVIASAFVSLTLTPVMCSLFLKPHSARTRGRLNRMAEHAFDALLRGYDRGLQLVLRHQFATLVATIALMVGDRLSLRDDPQGLLPAAGHRLHLRPGRGAPGYLVRRAWPSCAHELADIVAQGSGGLGRVLFVGTTGGNPTENTARMFIQLKPFDERDVTAQQVIQRLRPRSRRSRAPSSSCRPARTSMSAAGSAKTQYQYTLTDTNSDELNHWAPIIEAGACASCRELQDVTSDQQIAAPHVAIEIDRDTASRLGVSRALIDETLYDAFGQRQVATIYTSTNQYKVVLEVAAAIPARPGRAVARSTCPAPNGAQVPLSTLRTISAKLEPLTINHQGQFPAVTLSFNLAPGVALGQAVEAIQRCRGRAQDAGHAPGLVPGHGAGLPGVAVSRRRCWSPPRSSSSTSCSACSTRATSIRSRSCRRCRRPASARCWR